MSETTPLLELQGVSKAFPGCLANDNIDLILEAGKIHALLGQNGAGKSTLVKIIYGVLQADKGELYWKGNATQIASPAVARELGIAMVFQHFSLFDSLTVLENISLGIPGGCSNNALRERTVEVSNRYGLPLDPDRHVYTLSVGERQRIEIVRCLLQNPSLLIMDEPTSVLTPQEVDLLFVTLRKLADEGVSILYISHKLDEIRSLCSAATILREGRCVASADPQVESSRSLAGLMIGEELAEPVRVGVPDFGEPLLRLDKLNLPASDSFSVSLHDISLTLRAGEILGIAGVAGNGQDELIKALCGEVQVQSAAIQMKTADNSSAQTSAAASVHALGTLQNIGTLGAGERRKLGLCTVPEERLGHAAVPDMSLTDNALLTGFHRMRLSTSGVISRAASQHFAADIIDQFDVQCRDSESNAASLSGGNLQKFVVGREILQSPNVLVVAQPTWGVDAGAAAAIHKALQALAANGAAVLVISQDLDELMQISHNILAICAGRVSDTYPTEAMNASQIGLLMGGKSLQDNQPLEDAS